MPASGVGAGEQRAGGSLLAGGDTADLQSPSIRCACAQKKSAVVLLGVTALQPGGGLGHTQMLDSPEAKQAQLIQALITREESGPALLCPHAG